MGSMKLHGSAYEIDEFITVLDITSPELKDAIDIYFEAFPENERQPLDKIKRRIVDREYNLVVVKRDTIVVGFSLFYVFEHLRFGLFDYMAIRKDYRNLGIGSKLFHKTYEYFKKDSPSRNFLLLEVENPAYGSVSERSIRLRRVKFYERLGATTIANFKYLLPPMSGNYPTEMLLMVYAGDNQIDINQNALRSILIAIYEKVYNRKLDDPYLCKMLENLTGNSNTHLCRRSRWQ